MELFLTSWAVNFFSSLALGAFVWRYSHGKQTNKIWAIFCFLVALASLGFWGSNFFDDRFTATCFINIINFSAALIPTLFFQFVISFLDLDRNHVSRKILPYFYAMSVFFVLLLFTPFIISEISPKYPFKFWLKPGPMYIPFMLFFVFLFIYSHFWVIRVLKFSEGLRKKQYTYFLIATITGVAGSITTFVPAFFPRVYPVGVLFVPLYCVFIAFAIVRYRLMDIEVIIRKTLVFAGLASFVFGVFAFITFVFQGFFAKYVHVGQFPLTLLSVLLIVLCYEPLRVFLINITDRYLFQKKFDYRKLLKEASQKMARVRNLDKLARLVVAFLVKKARLASVSVYVCPTEGSHFEMRASRPPLKSERYKIIERNHPLIEYLKSEKKLIELHELEQEYKNCGPGNKEKLKIAYDLFQTLKIEAIIPSFLEVDDAGSKDKLELRSLLFLGAKKSDEPYSQGDLDVFYTLAQESAIAVENARLYDEGIQKTKENIELKLQLSRKQTLANLAGSIAHEIKGPVQLIQLSNVAIRRLFPKIEKLLDGVLDAEIKKKLFNEIMDGLSKYLGMSDEANDRQLTTAMTIERFAKMDDVDVENIHEEALATFERHEIDVYTLLNLVAEFVKIQCQFRDDYAVEIDTSQVASQLPHIKMHQNLLKQVLVNLLLNAYDALKNRASKKITINASFDPADHEFIRLEINDTGSGILPEMVEKMWQYGETSKVDGKGSGYGLYLCKFIIEKIHGGRISCDTIAGVGTTFRLKLPLWKDEQ